jgi:hypothetical protein
LGLLDSAIVDRNGQNSARHPSRERTVALQQTGYAQTVRGQCHHGCRHIAGLGRSPLYLAAPLGSAPEFSERPRQVQNWRGSRCQEVPQNSSRHERCHLLPRDPGDIWVTSDLRRSQRRIRTGSDLWKCVELRIRTLPIAAGISPCGPTVTWNCSSRSGHIWSPGSNYGDAGWSAAPRRARNTYT